MQMDTIAADRILAVVGVEFIPLDLDKAAMMRGLNLCLEWYKEALRYTSDVEENNRVRRLTLIVKSAKRLEQLLIEDDSRRPYEWDSLCRRLASTNKDPLPTIKTLLEMAERDLNASERTEGPDKPYHKSFKKWSAFEWLAGRWLPLVYIELGLKDHGSLQQLVSKDSPVINFILATLEEFNIKKRDAAYSRHSVVKAVKLPFSGCTRRKNATSADDYAWWRYQLLLRTMKPHLFQDDET